MWPFRCMRNNLPGWFQGHTNVARERSQSPPPRPTKARRLAMETRASPDKHQSFMLGSNATLHLERGNIVEFEGDAIVNAANPTLLGGAGVDGAIHAAAGRALLKACMDLPETDSNVRCPTGEARLTGAFRLPAKFIIHTVGPIYKNDKESEPLLIAAYKNSLHLANQNNFHTIAFPTISCGFYGYPLDKAAEVSLRAVAESVGNVEQVHFMIFSTAAWKAYLRAAESQFRKTRLEDG